MDAETARRLAQHRAQEQALDAQFAALREEQAKLAQFRELHAEMTQIQADLAAANRELDAREAELAQQARQCPSLDMQQELSRENYRKLMLLVDDYAWRDAPNRQTLSGEDERNCFLSLHADGVLQAEFFVDKELLC